MSPWSESKGLTDGKISNNNLRSRGCSATQGSWMGLKWRGEGESNAKLGNWEPAKQVRDHPNLLMKISLQPHYRVWEYETDPFNLPSPTIPSVSPRILAHPKAASFNCSGPVIFFPSFTCKHELYDQFLNITETHHVGQPISAAVEVQNQTEGCVSHLELNSIRGCQYIT